MIIWINGAYAVGKSTVAPLVAKSRPGALLYDPEPLGYYLRDTLKPVQRAQDYQELAIFVPVVLEIARQLHGYGRDIIMPLGVWQPDQFRAIHQGLSAIDELKHFCLTASRTTCIHRLLYRGDGQQAQRWIRERLDDCIEAMQSEQFEHHILSDGKEPEEIATEIIEELQK